jgi:acyl-CoA synthetase (AMP-forming)/AMP-acid ligase II
VTHRDLLDDDARRAGISTLVELLEHRAERQPDELVFRFVSGDGAEDGTLTFAELRQRARAIGTALASVAAPGERIVLLVPPGLDYVAAYFGCLYSGAIAVPATLRIRGAPIRASRASSRIRARAWRS